LTQDSLTQRLRRLMCGRPLAFRRALDCFWASPVLGRSPTVRRSLTEARSASAHQTAEPRLGLTFEEGEQVVNLRSSVAQVVNFAKIAKQAN